MSPSSGALCVTHDTIAEGVHFLSSDPAASVGWKLVAVNLSDLAAKGATPAAALLSLTMCGAGKWELAFLGGIEAACESYGLPLIGGDTIALPAGAPRVLGLTAIGHAGKAVPDRAGAKPGDHSLADRHCWGRCGRSCTAARGPQRDRPARRNLSPPGSAAQCRPSPRTPRKRDDGHFRRLVARRETHGASEPLPDSHPPRHPAAVGAFIEARARTSTRACSQLPAATIMRCSPRCRRTSIRQHFLYQKGPRSSGSGPSKRAPCRCA